MATDTTPHPLPSTPAEVAAAVLDAIEAHPESFDMDTWWSPDDATYRLPPGADLCGTTMCAAGWAAHVTGWTLVITIDGNLNAEKSGQRRLLSDVAAAALGLSPEETFWYAREHDAIDRLREIAGRT